jgi:hypothetical protein
MAAKAIIKGDRGYFVAVRRGFPGEVLACGYTRNELKSRFHPGPWKRTQKFFRVAKTGQQKEGSGDE